MRAAPKLSIFLMNKAAQKALDALVAAFLESVNPPGDDEMVETPELSPDQLAVLMHAIYDELADVAADLMGSDVEDDGSDDDEYASVQSDVELARGNKDMSQFYKAFMGKMKDCTQPWHTDRAAFLEAWAALGNETAALSPAPESETVYALTVVPVNDMSADEEVASEVPPENVHVETAGGLPTSLLQAFSDWKFTRNNENPHAITYELFGNELAEGYRIEVSRDMEDAAGAYTITLIGKVRVKTDKGVVVKSRQLTSNATTDEIVRVIAKFKAIAATNTVV